LHSELEGLELGDDVLRDLVGDVLVDRLAASPADVLLVSGIAVTLAEQRSREDLCVGEDAGHARLMPVPDRVVGHVLVDPVEEDQLVRERRHCRVQRMTVQVHVGRGAPDVLPRAICRKPEDDSLGSGAGLRGPGSRHHGVEHRQANRYRAAKDRALEHRATLDSLHCAPPASSSTARR
jgi:hypothetical protein